MEVGDERRRGGNEGKEERIGEEKQHMGKVRERHIFILVLL